MSNIMPFQEMASMAEAIAKSRLFGMQDTNSVLALIWLPLVVNFALEHFIGRGQYIPPPVQKIVEVAVIIVLPVAIGMIARARSARVNIC